MAVTAWHGQAARAANDGPRAAGPLTRVETVNGVPTFTIDGCPLLTPGFETYAPDEKYFRQFAAAGTRVFSFNANAAACDYGHSRPVWVQEQVWDYSQFEERAERVLAARPDALLLPRINLGTPRWWLDQHPDTWERFDDGTAIPEGTHPTLPPGRAFPALASPTWRAAIGDALRRLIEHVLDSRFGPHLFGWFLSGLHTEEFYHWACSTERTAGYSASTVAAFRAWLRARYGTDAKLQDAWHDPQVGLDTAQVPSRAERRDGGDGLFRDPARLRNVLDFYAFWNELIPETIDYFAAIARRASSGRKVVGAFYGYLYEFAGNPEFGHNAVARLMRSPNIDFMAVTASYHHRAAGTGGDYMRSPATSLRLHGKLWYHDNDVVSYRAREIMERIGFRDDADWTRNLSLQLASLGYTETPRQSRWMYRRGFGFALCQGMFPAWFDLHGGYFDGPELMAEVQRLGDVARRCAGFERSSCAQILVIADEASCALVPPGSPLLRETLLDPQNELIRLGAPVDHMLLNDLETADLTPYRLVILLNCWYLTECQRQSIRRRLMNAGRHLLWCGGAGWYGSQGSCQDNAESLTGFRVVRSERAEPSFALKEQTGERPYDEEVGPAAQIARRGQRGWTSWWTPTAALPARVYRGLARSAGVHIFNDRDDVLYLNRSVLCLHGKGDGPRTLSFPHPIDLVDLCRNQQVAADVEHWTTSVSHGETVLLQIAAHNIRHTPPVMLP